MIRKTMSAVGAWLARVPVEDPVDRRNAPFVQLLLLAMGTLMPINKVVHLFFTSFRHSMSVPGLITDMLTDVLMMGAAWFGIFLIRRGAFRPAVKMYIGVMLFSAAWAYSLIGLDRLSNDPFPLLLLGLGGLVLGRRTLWTVYGLLMVVFALGTVADIYHQWGSGPLDIPIGKKVSMAMSYAVVAFVLDRTIDALRESLAESNARGQLLQIVNERLRREMDDRARAQQLLIHAQKLQTVGRVAGGVAHDFSNVLGVILGYAQRRERLADSGTGALLTALQGVEKAATRGMSITRRLLGFSRQEATQLEVFDASEALRELLPMVCQLFDTNVRVQLSPANTPHAIRFDRTQFELVVLSMAANARDAMPLGGNFMMAVQGDAEHVEVVLSDNGTGMSDDVSSRVFEAFFTTKPAESGTGLGLAVVKDLVYAAGGQVDVRSAIGFGTTFHIRLPRKDLAAVSMMPLPA
ncbi:ATP-binding protein [Dyella sp. C11]|uniref:sensor histidine kinase n=1 Tax=Dyella sp. C11 TaxID=2126991 RepID=UPI0013009312|nr:ATP-binding protein [Dyella sp. C11]